MREKIKKHINLIAIVVIGVFTLLLMWNKLFNNVWESGHDDWYHIPLVRGYVEAISNGNWFPNILPEVGYGMGYASPMLYPTTMHWLIALLATILPVSNNVEVAIDIAFFLNFFFSGISIYFLSKYVFKNKIVALISAILYISTSFHISTISVRFSVSESWIYVFLPILVLGIFKFIKKDYKSINFPFTLGLIGCMYSHINTTLFIVIFLSVFCLVYAKQLFTKQNIICLIKCSVIVLLVTAPLYINILYFKDTHDLNVFVPGRMGDSSSLLGYVIPINEQLYLPADQVTQSVTRLNGIKVSMGLSLFILLVVSLITTFFQDKDNKNNILKLLCVLVPVMLFLSLTPPLNNPKFLDYLSLLQFPFRMLIPFDVLVCLIAPTVLLLIQKLKTNIYVYISIALVAR